MAADEQETEGLWQRWSSGLYSGMVPAECQHHLVRNLVQASVPATSADVNQTNETLNEEIIKTMKEEQERKQASHVARESLSN